MTDLKGYTLAEHVSVQRGEHYARLTWDFLCPNCGQRHVTHELIRRDADFQFLTCVLPCGEVRIRMPWATTPLREKTFVLRLDRRCEPIIAADGAALRVGAVGAPPATKDESRSAADALR